MTGYHCRGAMGVSGTNWVKFHEISGGSPTSVGLLFEAFSTGAAGENFYDFTPFHKHFLQAPQAKISRF